MIFDTRRSVCASEPTELTSSGRRESKSATTFRVLVMALSRLSFCCAKFPVTVLRLVITLPSTWSRPAKVFVSVEVWSTSDVIEA
ncbi:Uncharacterised protein [Mycobacteroides abscessus]|nr:Uncharacterised protein [Mycobacteroides abscessus]